MYYTLYDYIYKSLYIYLHNSYTMMKALGKLKEKTKSKCYFTCRQSRHRGDL